MERTIQECIAESILKELLEQHRAETKVMSTYEYNEEEHLRMERGDAFESGYESGYKEGQEQERQNTEKERHRAEMAEAENERLKIELEKLSILLEAK